MAQASERPRRKRLSWESRCEIVWRIEQGMSPPLAAASGGAPHPPSTIGKMLRRHGCSRLPRPEGAARCARRYERQRPGELLHIDTKKLGRFWEPGKRARYPIRLDEFDEA